MALQDPNVGPAPVRVLAALRGTPETLCPPELLLATKSPSTATSKSPNPPLWPFNPAHPPTHLSPTTRQPQPAKPGKKKISPLRNEPQTTENKVGQPPPGPQPRPRTRSKWNEDRIQNNARRRT